MTSELDIHAALEDKFRGNEARARRYMCGGDRDSRGGCFP
jgi:hypothetical protein